MKNLLWLALLLPGLMVGCSTQTNRSLAASLYADKVYICTADRVEFILEGSDAHKKGFIQVNGSDRIQAAYEDSGMEATWWWGERVTGGDSMFNNSNMKYRVIVNAMGHGTYISGGTSLSLACIKGGE